jgi:hypothetical protein
MADAFLELKFRYKNFLMEYFFFLNFTKNLTAHCSLFPYTVKENIKDFQAIFKTLS